MHLPVRSYCYVIGSVKTSFIQTEHPLHDPQINSYVMLYLIFVGFYLYLIAKEAMHSVTFQILAGHLQ